MMRWGDERAVTVQIGAVLLLAILFTALALYQVNAVPAENEVVEIEHNDVVHNEMQDLRNAIQNVATGDESRSTAVTLGTQYQTRTFATNPPNPRGTLRTSEPGSIKFDDVDIVDPDSYDGPVDGLLDEDLETRSIMYEPGYNEYTQAPVTRIEHGFAFNDFDGTGVGLTSQPVVDGTDITIIQVDGDLSESSSGAVSVDARLGSGPTDPIKIRPEGDDGVVEIPTQTPDAWNESIDESTVTIDSYSGGILSIELEEDEEYELRMACVVVGDGTGDGCDNFEITEETSDPIGEGKATVLPGPKVVEDGLELAEETVEQGEDIDIEEANFSNIGTTDVPRGGTPIVDAEWYILEEGEPELGEGNELSPQQEENFNERQVDTEGKIDTDELDLEAGDYTVSVRAQDTRGIWTNEGADGKTRNFTVVEDGESTGTVDLQEEILTNDDDFDVEWEAQNTGGNATLVVENVDEGEEEEIIVGDGDDIETIAADDVGGLGNGDTIEATLYESDDRQNALDSDTTEVSTPVGPFYPIDSTVNAGELNDFENMQNDDSNVAEMRAEGSPDNTPFDIDTITEDVTTGDYTLEIQINGGSAQQGDGVNVIVTNENDEQVGSENIGDENIGELITVDIAEEVEGELTVNYEADNQNNELDIDFQRFIVSEE